MFIYRVFLSYSRRNLSLAKLITVSINHALPFTELWIDKQALRPTQRWRDEIDDALAVCDILLLVVTPSSMASQYVELEWRFFLDRRKTILPIYYQKAEIPSELAEIQYADCVSLTEAQCAAKAALLVQESRYDWLVNKFLNFKEKQRPSQVDELVTSKDPQSVPLLEHLFEHAIKTPSDDTATQWYLAGLRKIGSEQSKAVLSKLKDRYWDELTPLLRLYFKT